MNAQDLLDQLLLLQQERGDGLSEIEVQFGYTSYDSSVPYDMGIPERGYPDSADVVYEDEHGRVVSKPIFLIQ